MGIDAINQSLVQIFKKEDGKQYAASSPGVTKDQLFSTLMKNYYLKNFTQTPDKTWEGEVVDRQTATNFLQNTHSRIV